MYRRVHREFLGDKNMKNKRTHTLEELLEAAGEQNLRVEEKDGKYKVVRTISKRHSLVTVKAGDGYALTHQELRSFLIANSVDIGERITNWSKRREPRLYK